MAKIFSRNVKIKRFYVITILKTLLTWNQNVKLVCHRKDLSIGVARNLDWERPKIETSNHMVILCYSWCTVLIFLIVLPEIIQKILIKSDYLLGYLWVWISKRWWWWSCDRNCCKFFTLGRSSHNRRIFFYLWLRSEYLRRATYIFKAAKQQTLHNFCGYRQACRNVGRAGGADFLKGTFNTVCTVIIRGGVFEDVLGLDDVLEDTFWSPWPWPRGLKSSKIGLSSTRGQHYFLEC